MEVTRGKIISLTQSKAEMEQSKKDLEAKRELLAKELEQVNQEIADVDSRLSQLPSALQQLEAEKHEQARQTYQLHKVSNRYQVPPKLTTRRFRKLMIFACVR